MDFGQAVRTATGDPVLMGLSAIWFVNSCIQTWDKRTVQRQKLLETGSYSVGDLATKEHWKSVRAVDDTNVFTINGQVAELRRGRLILLSWLHIGLLVALAVMNWQWALVLYLGTFVLAVLPVLEWLGTLMSKPFYRVLQKGIDY